MSFHFRPAKRENVGYLISLAGGTGSGKTYSAMELATGLSGGGRFCVLDTESRRALHYADEFAFDHGVLEPPFTPARYAEAVAAAVAAQYKVIVIDSASHVHAGEGGILEMHDAELDRMAGQDWKKREACNMAAWVRPKGENRKFVNQLLSLPPGVHLILCLRAEPKVELVKEEGKLVVRPKRSLVGLDGWIPISEKNLPFEMTLSVLMTADHPGIPRPIKLQQQHRALVPLDSPINRRVGEALAEWATGSKVEAPAPETLPRPEKPPESGPLTDDTLIIDIIERLGRHGVKCANGKTYGTFNEALAATAVPFVATGEPVRISYEKVFRRLEFLAVEDANVI